MYRRGDPRLRRTLNEISQTIESANESAQANIFTFSHNYLSPCFSSVGACFRSCIHTCYTGDDHRRRSRARSRGRAELSFDFYDDWDEDEDDGLLGWSTDEFDALLPASASVQPSRQRAMSYGARRDAKYNNRRRSQARDPADDPTVIPASSYFGFLGRLTGKIGGRKALHYKPSAADLQEHPGAGKRNQSSTAAAGSILEEDDEDDGSASRIRKDGRSRSGTAGSNNTTDSLSSRGDIFPSEDELDDAIPLDDEFAMVLERRTTNSNLDEASSGRTRGKRPSAASRLSTRTMSSRSTRSSKRYSRAPSRSPSRDVLVEEEPKPVPSLEELRQEEERARREEEKDIAQKREAAKRLALERGLSYPQSLNGPQSASTEKKQLPPIPPEAETPAEETIPFPPFDPPPAEDTPSNSATPLDDMTDKRLSTTEVTEQPSARDSDEQRFVPAQLPHFPSN